jgi:hypothetical protein
MSCEGVTAYPERIEEVIRTSIKAMKNKEGFFAFVDPQPERNFIDQAKAKGPEFALNATFLISTMVLGGKTEPFFRRISIPEKFEEYSWLFEPNEAIKWTDDQIINACREYFRPAGRQREPIFQWPYNCRKLSDEYGGLVSNYFKKRDNDAIRIYNDLVVRPRAKTFEKEIRRLGPKITKLMIQWVQEYNLYDLVNTNEVGLPVDFQLGRVMIQTEGLKLEKPVNTHFIVHKVLPVIFDDLRLKGYRPEDISKSLWAIGSGGCGYKRHDMCPLKDLCTSLISTKRYDQNGLFDPRDVGRYK